MHAHMRPESKTAAPNVARKDPHAMTTAYGVYPEDPDVIEAGERRVLVVRNRFYEIEHSLEHGGAISAIRLLKAGGENLLSGPCGCELGLVGAAKPFLPGREATVEVRRGEEPVLVFQSPMKDADGHDCGAVLRVTYHHRWGHIKIRQELTLPADGLEVNRLLLHSWVLPPEFTHYAFRPGAPAEAAVYPPWAMGLCQWGRFSPGNAFNCTYESRYVPRYVCFSEPGRRGLEWFVGSELAQWDYQLTGAPGRGGLRIEPRANPPSVALGICALDIPMGSVKLRGRFVFDSYIGIPILSGRAHQPFLNKSFQRKPWPTNERVESWARQGVHTAHFHHDGDSGRDGIFWRDGAYPPFEPADMKEFDRVIAACHRHGIRVATYFSNKELHPSVQAYKEHALQWARLPEDRRRVFHNDAVGNQYGVQMCLRSGWMDSFKEYVDKVLSRHDLDGTYYDWNVGMYCHNLGHDGSPYAMDQIPEGALGTWAFSPGGHWDIDELLDLMLWTRRRVGPEGLSIVHTTMCPMAATENFADYVVAMEWGYSKLSTGAPAMGDLPLEWSFMGSRSRGVIGYGCLEADAPESVHRQMTLRCLLTGVAPWPALDLDLEMFAPIKGMDMRGFVFHDWRNGIATVQDADAATSVYAGAERLLVLVGDLSGKARPLDCTIHLAPDLFSSRELFRVTVADAVTVANRDDLKTVGVSVHPPADGVALIVVEPL
jgi:hypothetical protein